MNLSELKAIAEKADGGHEVTDAYILFVKKIPPSVVLKMIERIEEAESMMECHAEQWGRNCPHCVHQKKWGEE